MSVLTWIADRLLGWRQEQKKTGAEIAETNANVRELQTDLDRWMVDHGRRLEAELRTIVQSAGPQLYAGSLRNQLENAMTLALEQYRNEASHKVRVFRRLARSEGAEHQRRRRGRSPSLTLNDEGRMLLAGWKERPYPVPHTKEGPLRPTDPTRGDTEVAPLDAPGGLSWSDAQLDPPRSSE